MLTLQNTDGLTYTQIRQAVEESLRGIHADRVLLIPPDITRSHSQAGLLTRLYYEALNGAHIDILPALGTHMAMTREEQIAMFGANIPASAYITHDWRNGVAEVGAVPGDLVREISEGKLDYEIEVELSRVILDGEYDLILSLGQVVPHEVVGMANYSKNLFVGCGGTRMINKTHYLGAIYGMERLMGRDTGPVRYVLDYAETHFIQDLPVCYVLTVTSPVKRDGVAIGEEANYDFGKHTAINGLFIGRERTVFEQAVALSQQTNLDFLDEPLNKVVVYLDPGEFRSTWLGNKAIYRTRMAIADGGELVIIAPGVGQFGEDGNIDGLIRKYGYFGRDRVLEQTLGNADLQNNLSAAAHLIHGSADGRFRTIYAAGKLTRAEVEGVGFGYMGAEEAGRYRLKDMRDGWNEVDGERVYYISNPALGLWAWRQRFA